MKIYQVGGCVRDLLRGAVSEDKDWVVVGASAQDMLNKKFIQVGADFPVFLHPQTKDEYALARVERKTSAGYLGFEVMTQDVTLEDDLQRRDLTINAMALGEDGVLVDPYGGQKDLADKVLRHVGPAFAEDPVRILRILRFQARFGPEWSIADETLQLIHRMVLTGEASSLVPERIWKETSRALMEKYPELFVKGLVTLGMHMLPCFKSYQFANRNNTYVLSNASLSGASLTSRFCLSFSGINLALTAPGIPLDVWRAARAWAEFQNSQALFFPSSFAEKTVTFMENIGAFKSDEVLSVLLECWQAHGLHRQALRKAVERARAVDTKAISASMPPGRAVGEAIRAARIRVIWGM